MWMQRAHRGNIVFEMIMPLRRILPILLALCCTVCAYAQDTMPMAQALVALKGGYADKKRDLEELRIRAYIPILLKAVGKGTAWKPGHPNWAETERRIASQWRTLYADYMARIGRDANFVWIDEALAREYARLFSAGELEALLNFYRSSAGIALVALEKAFLDFYPEAMVRALARVMIGHDTLSDRERAAFRAPANRERREFVRLFESETLLHEESLRIGGAFVAENDTSIQQGALATAADNIDALRLAIAVATLAEVRGFLQSDAARKEREFLAVALLTVTPAHEDAAQVKREESAFYKRLAELSAQWRELAARTAEK